MKKNVMMVVMVIVMMVTFMVTVIAENENTLKNYLDVTDYHWIDDNFFEGKDGIFNVIDDSVYIYGSSTCLDKRYWSLTDKEVEKQLTDECQNFGVKNPAVFIKTLTNNLVVIYIYSATDFSKNDEMIGGLAYDGIELTDELHNYNVLCWRTYDDMK